MNILKRIVRRLGNWLRDGGPPAGITQQPFYEFLTEEFREKMLRHIAEARGDFRKRKEADRPPAGKASDRNSTRLAK